MFSFQNSIDFCSVKWYNNLIKKRKDKIQMKVFLMMGQSNMAGRGDPRDIAPLPSTHAFVLRNGKWQPMTEPINIDRPIKFTGSMGTNIIFTAPQ